MAALSLRLLGTQGLRVSEIGLGCVGISELYGPRELDESRAMLRRALEHGVDFFDTADVYGAGHNEQFLGEAFGAERRRLVLACASVARQNSVRGVLNAEVRAYRIWYGP